ncbi:hypothetical protein CFC21_069603 [Triticum aestivum]|uniref:Uncharacterized protein n=2 Tax=Triticum aestivum TaxID=4565 RepID=A0A9R1KQX7_WHEAT|nr:hypothetical protein CFC21_069603 [Triticum aestivum]
MPSPLKRPSLGRLLAALRSPSRVPVQTGFPTSLADLVVKNHGRLRKPRKPRRPTIALALPPSPAENAAEVGEIPSLPTPPGPLSPVVAEDSSAPVGRRLDAPKGAAFFRPRPELLALGGAVALALLAVWSEGTVAAFTIASLSLLWIESASRWRRRSSRPRLADSGGGRSALLLRFRQEQRGPLPSDLRRRRSGHTEEESEEIAEEDNLQDAAEEAQGEGRLGL